MRRRQNTFFITEGVENVYDARWHYDLFEPLEWWDDDMDDDLDETQIEDHLFTINAVRPIGMGRVEWIGLPKTSSPKPSQYDGMEDWDDEFPYAI